MISDRKSGIKRGESGEREGKGRMGDRGKMGEKWREAAGKPPPASMGEERKRGERERLWEEMAVEVILDAGDEMVAGATAVDAVVAVGIELHVELVARLGEGFGEFGGVLEVDVVVGCAVDKKEVAFDAFMAMKGGAVVAVGVLLRSAHEAFGIDGVVEAPVGDGCDGYAAVEHSPTLAECHECVETSETPSPDGDADGIHAGLM